MSGARTRVVEKSLPFLNANPLGILQRNFGVHNVLSKMCTSANLIIKWIICVCVCVRAECVCCMNSYSYNGDTVYYYIYIYIYIYIFIYIYKLMYTNFNVNISMII